MADPSDDFDARLRSIAARAIREGELDSSTESALDAAHRSAATRATTVDDAPTSRSSVPRWTILAAAAAVTGMVAGGLVTGLSDDDVRVRTVPLTTPSVSAPPTEPTIARSTSSEPTPAPATMPPPPTTVVPTTTVAAVGPAGFAVKDECDAATSRCVRRAIAEDGRVVAHRPDSATISLLDASGGSLLSTIALADSIAADFRTWSASAPQR